MIFNLIEQPLGRIDTWGFLLSVRYISNALSIMSNVRFIEQLMVF